MAKIQHRHMAGWGGKIGAFTAQLAVGRRFGTTKYMATLDPAEGMLVYEWNNI